MDFRILHFAPDDKFIPLTIELYEEAFPGKNTFCIFAGSRKTRRFVAAQRAVKFVTAEYFESAEVAQDLKRTSCVILHSANLTFVNGLASAPASTLVVWSGWGFDYYYSLLSAQLGPLELPETAGLVASLEARRRSGAAARIKALASEAKAGIIDALPGSFSQDSELHPLQLIAGRIDAFSVLPQEVPLLRRALPALKGTLHCLPYFTVEDTFETGPSRMEGPDILLGNSATSTNNHLEALQMLRALDIGAAKIITPLSYGSDEYADAVSEYAERIFGSAFVPLRTFLSLEQYHNHIAACGTVIMNHRRQQALGNISLALYKGAKVFLREENPVYSFYRDQGLHVHAIAELQPGCRQLEPLPQQARHRNRELITQFWSRKCALAQINALPRLYRLKQSEPGRV